MKYLVTILMVLLMVNFWAQAADDTATPVSETAIAKPINKDDIITAPNAESTYVKSTMKGGKENINSDVQGKMKDCEKVDAFGRCSDVTPGRAVAKKGTGTSKGKDGRVSNPTTEKASNTK